MLTRSHCLRVDLATTGAGAARPGLCTEQQKQAKFRFAASPGSARGRFRRWNCRSIFQSIVCYQTVQDCSRYLVCTGGLDQRVASSDSGKHAQCNSVSQIRRTPNTFALAGFRLTAILLQRLLQGIQLLHDKHHLRQRRKAQLILSFNNYSRMRAARLFGKSFCQCHKEITPPSMTSKFW